MEGVHHHPTLLPWRRDTYRRMWGNDRRCSRVRSVDRHAPEPCCFLSEPAPGSETGHVTEPGSNQTSPANSSLFPFKIAGNNLISSVPNSFLMFGASSNLLCLRFPEMCNHSLLYLSGNNTVKIIHSWYWFWPICEHCSTGQESQWTVLRLWG